MGPKFVIAQHLNDVCIGTDQVETTAKMIWCLLYLSDSHVVAFEVRSESALVPKDLRAQRFNVVRLPKKRQVSEFAVSGS